MNQPSKFQLQAIKHLSGPAQIIAGPGSGKTFTIIQRILYLIQHHKISPDQILVITFTKAAALEMKERYESAIESEVISGHVQFGTFHSVCYHILQKSAGFSPNSLIKESDKRKIMNIILANHGYEAKCNNEVIMDLLSEISRQKNIMKDEHEKDAMLEPEQQTFMPVYQPEQQTKCLSEDQVKEQAETEIKCIGGFSAEEISQFKDEYQLQLKEQKKLDFDDMIGECLNLLKENSGICSRYQNQFRYILVDEFQDINLPQYQVIRLLAGERANLFVVGDDDQAIYGFRGATPGIMKRFLLDYPGCKQIMLTENYRSGANIVSLAGKVIERNKERFEKEFLPIRKQGEIFCHCLDLRKEEEELLVKNIKELPPEIRNRSAVILRTNREVLQYQALLKQNQIPVREIKPAAGDIFHSFMIEDMTAFLAFLYEGQKRSDFLKFMNKPNRFFTRLALSGERVSGEEMKQYYIQNEAMKREVDRFFNKLYMAQSLSPYMAAVMFRKTIGYDHYIKEKAVTYQEYQRLMEQTDRILELLKGYQGGIPAEAFFRQEEEKHGRCSSQTMQAEGISVITMHGAKGLEFEHVYLPDVNEGIIPGKNCTSKEELEEERRLLYVAITRARDFLHIYFTKERNRKISSYLKGIILPQ